MIHEGHEGTRITGDVFEFCGARVICGEALEELRAMESESVNCVVTSPPYWGLRDYGVDRQLGLESTSGEYVEKMVLVFDEVRRVLRGDGVCWVNMGDTYASMNGACRNPGGGPESFGKYLKAAGVIPSLRGAPSRMLRPGTEGLKPKDLVGMPWRLAFALQSAGWWLRSDCIWSKRNPMPESVKDRPTKSHEYVFMLTKSARYWYDAGAVREGVTGTSHERGTAGTNPKALSADAQRTRANASFSAAVRNVVGSRNARTVMEADEQPVLFEGAGETPALQSEKTAGKGSRIYQDRDVAHVARGNGGKHRQAAAHSAGRRILEACAAARAAGADHDEPFGPGRNCWTVWELPTQAYRDAHFATFPEALAERCILSGCPEGGVVLDPFAGSGTTLLVARRLGRRAVGIELNPAYVEMIEKRLAQGYLEFVGTIHEGHEEQEQEQEQEQELEKRNGT